MADDWEEITLVNTAADEPCLLLELDAEVIEIYIMWFLDIEDLANLVIASRPLIERVINSVLNEESNRRELVRVSRGKQSLLMKAFFLRLPADEVVALAEKFADDVVLASVVESFCDWYWFLWAKCPRAATWTPARLCRLGGLAAVSSEYLGEMSHALTATKKNSFNRKLSEQELSDVDELIGLWTASNDDPQDVAECMVQFYQRAESIRETVPHLVRVAKAQEQLIAPLLHALDEEVVSLKEALTGERRDIWEATYAGVTTDFLSQVVDISLLESHVRITPILNAMTDCDTKRYFTWLGLKWVNMLLTHPERADEHIDMATRISGYRNRWDPRH